MHTSEFTDVFIHKIISLQNILQCMQKHFLFNITIHTQPHKVHKCISDAHINIYNKNPQLYLSKRTCDFHPKHEYMRWRFYTSMLNLNVQIACRL